jgi:protein farnesyltransferase/geranylgeranyltransferase type-1 subunit alpha
MFFVKKTKDYEAELKAIQHTLELDAKNYHCWTYRKWLCDYFDLFDKEKQEVELYIDNDVMNNSAWVYRFYLYNRGEYRAIKDPGVIEKEIQYVMGKLSAEPANEAAWNYLNG